MYLTRHETTGGPRWALDGRFLPPSFTLDVLLQLPKAALGGFLAAFPKGTPTAGAPLLAPVEPTSEVWAAGVTYLRSRDAREEESRGQGRLRRASTRRSGPSCSSRPTGWRVAGHGMPIRVRDDSAWNVPEPELALVINSAGEIVGHTICNDVSSRDIEGENPLYLPQAKVYNGSCAVGPGLHVGNTDRLKDLTIASRSRAAGARRSRARPARRRSSARSTSWPTTCSWSSTSRTGAFLSTGTGIVPGQDFSLTHGDVVAITIGGADDVTTMTLENEVAGKSTLSQPEK